MSAGGDILIGIDAGTSVIKSIAFDLQGNQVAMASVPNRYQTRPDGAAVQSMDDTWTDCARTLRDLGAKVDDLATRTVSVAVTGQGDGTWLIDRDNRPVTEAWLWLDARAAPVVERERGGAADRARFGITGAGLNVCQMGTQLAHMKDTAPEMVQAADAALHCKDWLYLNLTGVRATAPCEAVFTFGDFRRRAYDDRVIEALGLLPEKRLLPEIVDGTQTTHPLSAEAAAATGLRAGTPVALGFLDVSCTALGGGIYTHGTPAGCTIIGSTGMHMRATLQDQAFFNDDLTGYIMPLPIPGMVAQIQSNMASTLNIDWLLNVAAGVLREFGHSVTEADLIDRIEGWLAASVPGQLLYHPYISEAGERGPFVDPAARASFIGLSTEHQFPDMVRAVVEGLGLAARDCYGAMGGTPQDIRLTGGAARSDALRRVFAAAVGASVRTSTREEAGAAGAAMMAAVAIGVYPDMEACIADWVSPRLGAPEAPDAALAAVYDRTYPAYRAARTALGPIWAALSKNGDASA
ncbi:Erythritol kinase EryA [Candidatus Rhodobacter oscarellae]|uniref:Erythritol kinase EryA n=1 Tax=Candidatus Rhodobacter oscarellae TaxID=1675527 RepID=A0A0J9DZR5_9RHOB|nr:FGGY-family carbohydrate kinase [Candidatus Rhodobacter lobularis]KMW56156.1 Erythritol kinase EryA [Candidatus Rhodobacter lobularis]